MSDDELRIINQKLSDIIEKRKWLIFLNDNLYNIPEENYKKCTELLTDMDKTLGKINELKTLISVSEDGLNNLSSNVKNYREYYNELYNTPKILEMNVTPQLIETITHNEIHAFIEKNYEGRFSINVDNARRASKEIKKLLNLDNSSFANLINDDTKIGEKSGIVRNQIVQWRKEIEVTRQRLKGLIDIVEKELDSTLGDKVNNYLEMRDKKYARN